MIDILNGYGFKRNFENVVVYPISQLAGVLGLPLHEVKEHYFHCVSDMCMAEGELHSEEIVNGEIEAYLPPYNVKALIDSLTREGFKLDEFQRESIVTKILETQSIVSDCFESKNGFSDYKDPIRKFGNPCVKPLSESISKNID